MQGRILVIDAISTNRIVLKVKLTGAFYKVLQASCIAEALETARHERPDLILAANGLPDGTAADLCRSLAATPSLARIPVIAIGAQITSAARLDTLTAGASDVMTHPVSETLLLGRVRSVIRARNALAEWQMREETSCALGLAEPAAEFAPAGRIALVGENIPLLQGWLRSLADQLRCNLRVTPLREALASQHAAQPADVIVIALPESEADEGAALRLISELRASAQTRHTGLLVVQLRPDEKRATTALDLGADDAMCNGFCAEELAVRLRALLRQKQQMERVHQTVRTGLREVVHDPLTGLFNRRYAMPHLARVLERSKQSGRCFAVILGDMDHFKRINDLYGHASGDAVLVEAANRLQNAARGFDMVARVGGEEFLILMPGTNSDIAQKVAERLRGHIHDAPFRIPGAKRPVPLTMSFGLAIGTPATESAEVLLDRADKALYSAKTRGRNRIGVCGKASRPAA